MGRSPPFSRPYNQQLALFLQTSAGRVNWVRFAKRPHSHPRFAKKRCLFAYFASDSALRVGFRFAKNAFSSLLATKRQRSLL
jgi:hypothetical protein